MGQGCRLFKRCRNPPPRYCGVGVQAAEAVSEPTSVALLGTGAGCFSGVGTYLPGTVGRRCRLFKRYRNLPAGHCGAGCLRGVGTYLLGTVGQASRLFKRRWNLPPGTVGQGCRLFNLPPRHCWAGVQAFQAVSVPYPPGCGAGVAGCLRGVRIYLPCTVEQGGRFFKWWRKPTSRALWGRGAGCLSVVGIYLPGTIGKGSRLFKRCHNLPSGHCGAGVQAA